MNRFIAALAACAALIGLAAPAQANTASLAPDTLVQNVTNEVLSIVRKDKDIQSGSQKRAIELVEAKVLPHFNFTHMTALAMGRDWRKASPEQRQALVGEFRTLLVRTYSNALTAYRDQTVEFKPATVKPDETDVTVRTQVIQPGTKPVSIDYNLEKLAEGWKVYDVVVAGVSLVTNYRETFASEVRKSGIDGLIAVIAEKNRSLEAQVANKGGRK